MKKILFVTNVLERCGVYQFGKTIYNATSSSNHYEFHYVECCQKEGDVKLIDTLNSFTPDAIFYNWHPITMPWLDDDLFLKIQSKLPALKHFTIVHDYPIPFHWMDAHLHIDPSFKEKGSHYRLGRIVPSYEPSNPPPENVIGSFGFGSAHKNYDKLVGRVNDEFDTATIRLHIPYSSYGDPNGVTAQKIVQECEGKCKKGISIEVNHAFLDEAKLLDWLAMNSINCFLYDRLDGAGISSTIDWALAAKRPIAISDSYMFRHIRKAEPSINIEETSLKEIIKNGITPLEPFFTQWTKENLLKNLERIIDEIFNGQKKLIQFESISNLDIENIIDISRDAHKKFSLVKRKTRKKFMSL